ncbi:MAG: hypothetical protein K2K64_12125 [Muribaculaceae bacterium]|nr:hypothetical protein [Muribaculaceae bacterium]
MKKKLYWLLSAMIVVTGGCNIGKRNTYIFYYGSNATLTDSINTALAYQVSHYPSSQYRDIYKNFMQDFFGPGHILKDTAASGRYLRSELMDDSTFGGPLYEKTGYKGNFYRVNLSLIKDSIIPYDVFFNAFVNSLQNITPPPGEVWMNIWGKVDSLITAGNYHFMNEEEDRLALADQFKKSNFIAHHSKRFNDSVRFHYRIISKDNFEKILLPFIMKEKELR